MNRRGFLKGLLATGVVTLVNPTLPTVPILKTKAINFDSLVAITLKNYRDVLAKNITDQQCLWIKLKEKGLVG